MLACEIEPARHSQGRKRIKEGGNRPLQARDKMEQTGKEHEPGKTYLRGTAKAKIRRQAHAEGGSMYGSAGLMHARAGLLAARRSLQLVDSFLTVQLLVSCHFQWHIYLLVVRISTLNHFG